MWISRVFVESWEFHSVLTKKLTELTIWISILALLRSGVLVVRVEELDLVDILWRPLGSVDFVITE